MAKTAYSSTATSAKPDADHLIDLRSDTVTKPTAAMLDAMLQAPLGDDVYGEDPSINTLEQQVAELLGKEAGLFVSSGTQSNLLGVMAHCQRGEEVIVGNCFHVYQHEACGAPVLGSVAMCPLPTDENARISLSGFKAAIKDRADPHYPVSKLLSLENTVSGMVQDQVHIGALCDFAHQQGMHTHLDGARLMNAAVAQGVSANELATPFDSVSLCLSKGLGAPVGSVLTGSHAVIGRARRLRKMLGGGMRQVGMLAAAGTYALTHHVERLQQDHARAARLAAGINAIDGLSAEYHTNMVFMQAPENNLAALQTAMLKQGICITAHHPKTRLVVHLGVSTDDIEQVLSALQNHQI